MLQTGSKSKRKRERQSDKCMINWKALGSNRTWYHSGICLNGIRKITKTSTINQNYFKRLFIYMLFSVLPWTTGYSNMETLFPSSEKEILVEAMIRTISFKSGLLFCPENGSGIFPPKR
jgi:hypothetical protein